MFNLNDPIIRSYLGKAYFEEKREPLPSTQFELAKELDPADPTPWFYDAIRKQTLIRPVEALTDNQRSVALNDNRAVYRSSLRLGVAPRVNDVYLLESKSAHLLHISRKHFAIEYANDQFFLLDRGSACGTTVAETHVGGDRRGGRAEIRGDTKWRRDHRGDR